MMIQLDDRLIQQLEIIAQKEGRDVQSVVQELIEGFLQQQAKTEFDTKIDRIMQEHAELLEKLASS